MKTITMNNIYFKAGRKYLTCVKNGKETRCKLPGEVREIMQDNNLLPAEKWHKVAKIADFYGL